MIVFKGIFGLLSALTAALRARPTALRFVVAVWLNCYPRGGKVWCGQRAAHSYGLRREPKSSASTNLTAALRARPTALRFVVAVWLNCYPLGGGKVWCG